MMMAIDLRPITALGEMAEVERLQRDIWIMTDLEIVPVHALQAIQANGGMLIGAFIGEKMVGFVVGILGTSQPPAANNLMMYSIMAGALPSYQGQGIGYQLKLAQREYALSQGLDLIMWTFDPLESVNGRFNIHKLGATCHTYLRDNYGELEGINAGLPTDRFKVSWQLSSKRVKACVAGEKRPTTYDTLISGGAILTNKPRFNKDGLLIPPDRIPIPDAPRILVEIPANIQTIKQHDFSLALCWREQTRHLFEALFKNGYAVTDFVTHFDGNGRRRSFYLLTSA